MRLTPAMSCTSASLGQRNPILRLHPLIRAVSCPPTYSDFRPSRPEPGLNSTCLLVTSCRGGDLPLFQIRIRYFHRLITKLDFLYTPCT